MGFGTREKMVDPPPFNPAVGVTASERYLGELYKRSFLSLSSYPGIPSHSLEQIVSVMGQRISPSQASAAGRLRSNGLLGNWNPAIPTFREAIDWAPPRQGRKELIMGDDRAA